MSMRTVSECSVKSYNKEEPVTFWSEYCQQFFNMTHVLFMEAYPILMNFIQI